VLDKRRGDARDESKTAAQIEDAVVRLEILGIGVKTGFVPLVFADFVEPRFRVGAKIVSDQSAKKSFTIIEFPA
jgi:hypothetical protein